MRPSLPPILALFLALGLANTALAQDAPDIPAGFTAYTISGPGIGNAPPRPFRIEGDHLVMPDDSNAVISIGRIEGNRLTAKFVQPGGPTRFIAVREGDAFVGYWFIEEGDNRGVNQVSLVPAGGHTTLELDHELLASAPGISRVEVVPGGITLASGEKRRFVARAFDESGAEIAEPDVAWYSMGGSITPEGEFVGYNAGERQVVALVNGVAIAATTVTVNEPSIQEIVLYTVVPGRLPAESRVPLDYDALNSIHRWNLDPEITITSSAPSVVGVEGDAIVALSPGRATVTLAADKTSETFEIEVIPARGDLRIAGTPTGPIRTGQVLTLGTSIPDARPVWSVAGSGAEIGPDGAFVAEEPGSYRVLATLGDQVDGVTIEVEPRGLEGRVNILGHGANPTMFTADIWPQNGYVYLGTAQANQIRTYDVSDPAIPILTDSITVDARVINSVKVSEDGRWLAATREGAANRKNGIVFFSLEDPAHPRLVSEYTETVTSGVHNVFWVGNLVYATNNGTGDMHIIDFSDPASPKEIGRWGIPVVGKTLHDIWAQDGILWMSYMMDGLVILDIGGAGKGGTPEKPVLVSRIFYPEGPTHNALRNRDYVFIGDEDFSLNTTKPGIAGLGATDPRGAVHVIDVSNLEHPRYVARFEVPEAGAHNLWIQDDVMYVGYYQGGIRIVDISGELRGDLYRQGREITHFLPQAGPEEAKLPYSPMTWGVYPMFQNGWRPAGKVLFATDYNSGLWSFTVERPEEERPIS
ncbi:MAG TPA: hypothetical protein VMR89_01235 [Actinomycetota bacterium]|nr:hypothetical protein [Actinomycetota bacterium]